MTIRQSSRYKAYTVALAHLNENLSITKDLPAFAEALQAANATLDAVAAADNRRQQDKLAITISKRQYREGLAHQAQLVANAIVTYATAQNDLGLKKAMNFSRSDLYHSNDKELESYITNILGMAQKLSEELKKYGISDEVMKSYAARVEEYRVAANEPRISQAERVEAGQQIDDGLRKLSDQLKNQLDKLMLQYKYSHPEFYNQYRQKRQLINGARRKTGLEGAVTEPAGKTGLADVDVLVNGSSLQTITGKDGSYLLVLPLFGETEITFRKEGYEPQTLKAEMIRGQRTRLDVVLKPLAG